MKCSHTACYADAEYTVTVTERDVESERKKHQKSMKLGIVKSNVQLVKPTPNVYYYCEKHKGRIDGNPLLGYLSSKVKLIQE